MLIQVLFSTHLASRSTHSTLLSLLCPEQLDLSQILSGAELSVSQSNVLNLLIWSTTDNCLIPLELPKNRIDSMQSKPKKSLLEERNDQIFIFFLIIFIKTICICLNTLSLNLNIFSAYLNIRMLLKIYVWIINYASLLFHHLKIIFEFVF